MAERNERNFSSEQIRRNRDAVIGLQAGTNIGATQVPPVCCQTLLLIYSASGWYGSHGEQQAHVKWFRYLYNLNMVFKILFMERRSSNAMLYIAAAFAIFRAIKINIVICQN